MVEPTLTQQLIDSGGSLVRRLDESGIPADAAFWFYFPDNRTWRLMIAQGRVAKEGPKSVYRRIQRILGRYPQEIAGLSLDDIVLVRTDAPIVALMRSAIRTGFALSGTRLTKSVIDGMVVEDAYIYRLL